MNKSIKNFINLAGISKALGYNRNTLPQHYKLGHKKYTAKIQELYDFLEKWWNEILEIKNKK